MFIIEFFKNFFKRLKTPKLEESYEKSVVIIDSDTNDNKNEFINSLKVEKLDNDNLDEDEIKFKKIKYIANVILENKFIISQIKDISYMNLNEIKAIINYLKEIGFNRKQVGYIIQANIEILEVNLQFVKDRYEYINYFIDNDKELKKIILKNPGLLTQNLETDIDDIYKIFEDEGIDKKLIIYIFKNNNIIFYLKENVILESINILKKYITDISNNIIAFADLIGIVDEEIIKEQLA